MHKQNTYRFIHIICNKEQVFNNQETPEKPDLQERMILQLWVKGWFCWDTLWQILPTTPYTPIHHHTLESIKLDSNSLLLLYLATVIQYLSKWKQETTPPMITSQSLHWRFFSYHEDIWTCSFIREIFSIMIGSTEVLSLPRVATENLPYIQCFLISNLYTDIPTEN